MNPPILEKQYVVHYYELDMAGRVRPVAILNYLQDAAEDHIRRLGLSMESLMSRGLTWVLSRIHLRVERPLEREEKILVRTWPASREGLFTCREFELHGGDGAVAARATTSWVVLDLQSRRPVALDDVFSLLPQRVMTSEFPTLPRLGRADQELAFPVRQSDLDINRHVNNAVYAGWALDTVPQEFAEHFSLVELEIAYRAEAFAGETVISRSAPTSGEEGTCIIHQLTAAKDGRELTRLRSRWIPLVRS